MIDSDSQVQRGFVQHRRARINGVNGEGQPLPSQVLEGEIAMNLITRKLYTKRQKFFVIPYTNTVNDFEESAGFIVNFSQLSFDSDTINIDYTINGNTKTLVIDSDSTILDIVNQYKNAAIAEVGASRVTSDASSVTFFRNVGASSVTFSSNFVKFIDFNYQQVIRVGLNASISLANSNASTVIDFDLATSGFRRTQGNGRLISQVGATLYLKDFTGIIAVGYKVSQREPRDEFEIVELNNIPTIKPTAPERSLAAGNMWIKNRDSDSGKLYWLDTSIMDDSDFQQSIRDMSPATRLEKNAAVVDSDGNGNLLYGEWRAIISTSLLGSGEGNAFDGNVTFNNNVIIDSDLIVNGNAEFNGSVHIDSDLVVDGNATIEQDLIVNGNATVEQDLTVNGQITIDSDLTVGNDLTVNGDATFNGPTNFNSTVGTYQQITNSGSATLTDAITYIHHQGAGTVTIPAHTINGAMINITTSGTMTISWSSNSQGISLGNATQLASGIYNTNTSRWYFSETVTS